MKKALAEFLGTFALVFCGTGAIVINDVSQGAISHLGIAITFGLIVTAMVYTFGSVSGAHINPAVSIAFAFTNLFSRKDLPVYLAAQLAGALVASWILRLLFENHPYLGATLPRGSEIQSLVLEAILTYFLMLVILFVSQNKATTQFTGMVAGATVMLEAMFAGPICGASMNPARSIGPAIVSGNLVSLWLYIVAPVAGAILATWTWKFMKDT